MIFSANEAASEIEADKAAANKSKVSFVTFPLKDVIVCSSKLTLFHLSYVPLHKFDAEKYIKDAVCYTLYPVFCHLSPSWQWKDPSRDTIKIRFVIEWPAGYHYHRICKLHQDKPYLNTIVLPPCKWIITQNGFEYQNALIVKMKPLRIWQHGRMPNNFLHKVQATQGEGNF